MDRQIPIEGDNAMTSKALRAATVLSCITILATALVARTATAAESEVHTFGVGYKIGNGLGFAGGDLIVRAWPHVSFDLQVNYLSASDTSYGDTLTLSGVGFAPGVHLQLKPVGHTPYVSVGALYLRFSAHDDVNSGTGTATGFFANVGYEWRFASHIGVLVGAGISDLLTLHGDTEAASFTYKPDKVFFNIESGLRYFF
jgi:hypothetical protein